MEEEEEEVLCYLDRVLEEEGVFEYGDGELDPITSTHRQFKVRQRLDSWMQGIYTHTRTHTLHTSATHTLTGHECSAIFSKVESLAGAFCFCAAAVLCVRAGVRACVRACVHACVCVSAWLEEATQEHMSSHSAAF